MAEIDLYADPVCPFTWVTTRWLLENSVEHTVMLRQMSLAVLNGHNADGNADADADDNTDDDPMFSRSRRIGRVFAAATSRFGPTAFASLYLALGPHLHPGTQETDEDAIAAALYASGFDPDLAEALNDESYDTNVHRAHEESQTALGGPGGSPIFAIDGHGFNGPVLTAPPKPDDAAALLSAVITAATTPGFAALQRPFDSPPDFTVPVD